MLDTKNNNKRIAQNTITLYVRMILIMIINLYTSRVVLDVLGVNDYGLYNVVGGVVIMFSVLSGSLNAAITRFITFELGTGNNKRLKAVFSSSVSIQISIAIILFFLIEIVGLWFINSKMVIERERIVAAQWTLFYSALTFCLNLISVPYTSAVIAHERMKVYAYISIFEAVLKLAVCFIIVFTCWDHLITYSCLLFAVALIIRVVYGYYCRCNFEECIFIFSFDKKLFKKMFLFSGWNFIGAGSGVLRDQGVNLLINLFCGPAVNAARGLAMQVSSAVSSFANSLITAINPQITKSYASNNKDYCFSLVMQGARFSSYLFIIIAIPLLLETYRFMSLWLVNVPEYSVIFVRLMIIYILTELVSYTMVNLMLATGDIRNYQLVVGGCQILNFPLSYVALSLGLEPYWTIIIAIVVAILCLIFRLIMLNKITGFPILIFAKSVLCNIILVIFCGIIVPLIMEYFMCDSWFKFISILFVAEVCTIISIYMIGLNQTERNEIYDKLLKMLNIR